MLRMIDIYFDVFFFKQKTAYEMRISDWSSDVCSSDLSTDKRHFFSPPGLAFRGAPVGLSSCYDPKNNPVQERHSHESIPWKARTHRDRKSVVEGKSVAVRVDLGGRRIINKKNESKQQEVQE